VSPGSSFELFQQQVARVKSACDDGFADVGGGEVGGLASNNPSSRSGGRPTVHGTGRSSVEN